MKAIKRDHSDVSVILVGLIGCLLLSVMPSYASGDKLFNISGIIRDEKGTPITDAWVRVKDLDKGMARTVLTNGGKYVIPGLWSGNYRIDSWKWGFDRVEKPLGNVGGNQTEDLTLKAWTRPITGWDLTEYDWLMILPGGKTEAGRPSDKMFYAYPTMFVGRAHHGKSVRGFPQNVIELSNPWNHKGIPDVWERIMAQIEAGHDHYDPKFASHWPGWREARIRFLKTAFDPDTVLQYNLRKFPLPITEETRRVVITEYDIPTAHSGCHSLAVDSKGNSWFSEMDTGALGKVDANTGKVTEYVIPERGDRADPKYKEQEWYHVFRGGQHAGPSGESPAPHGVAIDSADNVWLSMLRISKIVKFDPRIESFDFYKTPNWDQYATFAAVDRKRGRVWVGGDFYGNSVHMLDVATGEVKTVVMPNKYVRPYGMNLDKDGNAYVGAIVEGALYRIDAETFKVTRYVPPTPLSGAHRICGDSKGRVWVTLSASMKLGMWDPKTENITEYDLPTEYGHPYGCVVDREDNVWFSDIFNHLLSKFNPETKSYIVYPFPSEGARTGGVRTPDIDSEGNVWFCDRLSNKVYKLDPDGLKGMQMQ